MLKNYSIVEVFAGSWMTNFPDESAEAADKVMPLVGAGALRPRVDRVLPLEQALRRCALLRSAAFGGGSCGGSDSREGAMADEARRGSIEDVREISTITYGFMASKALFAALGS